ncbi:hypothetical protein GCM10022234_09410 [Aeromicrobium panaciterrae]|uniref:TetR/AcrR family transcriptional regulator n=1 Tax=Aeromicrobium panaciterrae TaxID=363861 RepID=UPI0031CDDF37
MARHPYDKSPPIPESPTIPDHRLEQAERDLRVAVRRQDGRETPVGPRALRTREKLLRIAQDLFSEKGYLSVSLNDIAESAGVSQGTVYQYFADRNDIVSTLAGERALRMLGRGADFWDPATGRLGLRRAINAIVTMQWENRAFFELWENASHADARLANLRRDLVAQFRRSFARTLERGVRDGYVRPDLIPEEMARAMSLMVSAYCYDAFIFDPPAEPMDPASAVDHLTALWADAIGLREARELRPQAESPLRAVPEDPL